MKIIIPLAGVGSRLRPHTYTRPKPLLKVAGKSILGRIIDDANVLENSGFIFVTGYLKDKIELFVKENYSFKSDFVEQINRNGTAGAIKITENYSNSEDLLIVYADTIFKTDLTIIDKVRNDPNIDGIIWVKEVEDYKRFGVVVTDSSGIITQFVEKPETYISNLANIGVYYIKDSKKLYSSINYVFENDLKVKGEYFLTDAIANMISNGSKLVIANVNDWFDCGTFEALLETNKSLLKSEHNIKSSLNNSVIIEPVFIDSNVLIENSVIGPNVSISSGSKISNSIVSDSIIESNSSVINSKITLSNVGESAKLIGVLNKCNIGDSSEIDY